MVAIGFSFPTIDARSSPIFQISGWLGLDHPWSPMNKVNDHVTYNLVSSSVSTRLRRDGEDSGKIEILNSFYWLLENNNSWCRILSFNERRETRVKVNPPQINMRCRCCCKFIVNNTIITP